MLINPYKIREPEAFRGFVEGVQNLQLYLRTNASDQLKDAEEQFNEALAAEPAFVAAQYYKAIALTHARRAEEAVEILEHLNQENVPFKIEVLYNLAFAYGKIYDYEKVRLALKTIIQAERLANKHQRLDLRLLAAALRAWAKAVFGAYSFGRDREDFQKRQKKYLPAAVRLAKSVLLDPSLDLLTAETSLAVKVEANGAAGGALMYMGLYSAPDRTSDYWESAHMYYNDALRLHPRNVRVLDNLATLQLMEAYRAMERNELDRAKIFASQARETQQRAISYHPHDRFRFSQLAQILALLGEWHDAELAANRILDEPGVVSKESVEKLKRLIHARELEPILNQYKTWEYPTEFLG